MTKLTFESIEVAGVITLAKPRAKGCGDFSILGSLGLGSRLMLCWGAWCPHGCLVKLRDSRIKVPGMRLMVPLSVFLRIGVDVLIFSFYVML